MDALAFLRQSAAYNDRISVPRIYLHMAGDPGAGLMLAQLVYWFEPGRDGKPRASVEKEGRLWVVKRWKDWMEECCLTEHQARRCAERLEGLGILTMSVWKSPLYDNNPTIHLSINWEGFLEKWQIEVRKRSDPGNDQTVIPGCADGQNLYLTGTTSHIHTGKEKKEGSAPAPVPRKGVYLDIDTMVEFLDKPKYSDSLGGMKAELRAWLEICESEGHPVSAAYLNQQLNFLLTLKRERARETLRNSAHKRLRYLAEPFVNGNGKPSKYNGTPTMKAGDYDYTPIDFDGNLNPGWCMVVDRVKGGHTTRRLDSLEPGDIPLNDDLEEMRL